MIFIDDDDLNELCAKLQLSFDDKLPFKGAVRSLKIPKKIIPVTPEKQQSIDDMEQASQRANDLKNALENYFIHAQKHSDEMSSAVHEHIYNIIELLQARQTCLQDAIELWVMEMIEITDEILNCSLNGLNPKDWRLICYSLQLLLPIEKKISIKS